MNGIINHKLYEEISKRSWRLLRRHHVDELRVGNLRICGVEKIGLWIYHRDTAPLLDMELILVELNRRGEIYRQGLGDFNRLDNARSTLREHMVLDDLAGAI